MRFPLLYPLLAAAAMAATAVPAQASSRADISVHDRRDSRELTVYRKDGRRYVIGEPGREYEIRIRNHGHQRLLAVTSVDGVNVLSGETASSEQSGYVVGSHEQTRIEGWRKNLSEVASFHFTRLPDSYAARTGRPDDVGVIGVALFREKQSPCCRGWRDDEDRYESPAKSAEPQAAPSAETESRAGAGASADSMAGERAPQARRKAERIGTGHGERLDSAAQQVEFERASSQPDDVIAIYYDTRANLVAQGVIPPPRRMYAQRRPDPFPAGGFVPDP